MKEHNIQPIDLVCINLYPFEQTVAKPNVTFEEVIENIDIGGPSMIRSASKNHRFVLVLTAPDQYAEVLAELRANRGSTTEPLRLRQAQRAFSRTAFYDAAIQSYLNSTLASSQQSTSLPSSLTLSLAKKQELRYGENPHQKAALYVDSQPSAVGSQSSVAFATQLHGKELSYINLLDADGALNVVKEFTRPAACIVKHVTPCGSAVADDLSTAFMRAYQGDPLAAFGGIVALNQNVDLATAQAITSIDKLLEVIVAPSYSGDALELLRSRWKNVRLLSVGPLTVSADSYHFHKIVGGYLVQQPDLLGVDEPNWKVVSKRQPTAQEWGDLKFAWVLCKHVKSNAITLAKDEMLVGSGAGQQDRVNACRIAIAKAGDRARGSVAASDAFFPFPDGPQLLLDAGITAIIHPGGSLRDQETIDAINKAGAAMVLTGQRHFRH
jgi:phosphoribosylaminoimidazolecarboxamide formyltransferase/IMP cyclohydrolase